MKRRLIVFDLDGTPAVTKSAISHLMANRLRDLLSVYEVCVISGGKFDQFKLQLKGRLDLTPMQMSRVHIMPTSGRRYLRFDDRNRDRVLQDTEDLAPETRAEIVDILTAGAKKLGYWETEPYEDIMEDRVSPITFSALGQEAPAERKSAWDPDGVKNGHCVTTRPNDCLIWRSTSAGLRRSMLRRPGSIRRTGCAS